MKIGAPVSSHYALIVEILNVFMSVEILNLIAQRSLIFFP